MRRAHRAHRAGGAVLLVVGVEDEEHVEGVLDLGCGHVARLHHLEHHAQEVAGNERSLSG